MEEGKGSLSEGKKYQSELGTLKKRVFALVDKLAYIPPSCFYMSDLQLSPFLCWRWYDVDLDLVDCEIKDVFFPSQEDDETEDFLRIASRN
ncbi:hypothetical protein CEXT_603181 [Caerostris extrusa]|uniref:Uncharacterized protein n=1 Tax=Caerostris extrusa TaxID=172846 RepID=A0AAV4V458_CAEEX|nr:hypothetical protein CEXT_603181 [Caerostris extrusa]